MKNEKMYIVTSLRKVSSAKSFSLLLIIAFFAACSTPTISSDDSDEKSSSSEKAEQDDNSSSSEERVVSSSSGAAEPAGVSSSSLVVSDGWSWDVPKEFRLNPEIEYDTIIDSRDGQVYKTVKIGDQVWMAENLNFASDQGGSGEKKYDWSWCYDDNSQKCNVAGRLYTWTAAIDSLKLATDAGNPLDCGFGKICSLPAKVQGSCPTGWHLPDTTEWNALFDGIGDRDNAGKVLKSQMGWYEGGYGMDDVGFSAQPAGGRDYDGKFYEDVGYRAYFWSATQVDDDFAYHVSLSYGSNRVYLSYNHKHYALSVRCVKN